jgi:hypothetical protein
MTKLKYILSVACCSLVLAANAQTAVQAPLDCSAGPVAKTLGGGRWNAYACSDDSTVLLVAVEGNAAAPFTFTLFRQDGRYNVAGEGTGSRLATARAHADLVALREADITALRTAAKSVPPRQ